jgi:two-component system, NtrC family, sensor histidine kinase HydH
MGRLVFQSPVFIPRRLSASEYPAMKKISFPILLNKSMPVVYFLALLLTLLIVVVGYTISKKIHGVITQQFNTQQLILARKISDQVQNQIAYLQTTLLGLRQIWELEIDENIHQPENIFFPFQKLTSGDLLAILAQDKEGRVIAQVRDSHWTPKAIPLPSPISLTRYLESDQVKNWVWVGRTFSLEGKWILPLAVPTQKRGAKPVIDGALFFIVDAIQIAQKADRGVISGSSGYPWIINSQGIFLDHFDPNFVGRNIFVVRGLKNPNISYKKIDDLTRDQLLKRKEGTSTYVTGWHRELIAVTNKLVAYTPIPFYETPDRNLRSEPIVADEFWSVAVVAPEEEVSGLVRNLNYLQAILFGIFQIIIIVSTGIFVFFSNRWSQYLKTEVSRKTEELKKSQDKLVQSERLAAVGSMASHVSHEIKNPLIAIGGLAGQLKRSTVLGEKEKGKLDLITNEISRLEKILVEVRDFSRPTTPAKIKSQLNPIIEDLIQLFNPLLNEQQIKINLLLDPDLPEFSFDPEQIRQVLINLTKNAIEAMPNGGMLTLVTGKVEDAVLIRVSDTGKGFDPLVRENLFRPFITTKKKGTGLGLAVSYKLIQDHNGDIQVESSEQGTTMTVRLPIEESRKEE